MSDKDYPLKSVPADKIVFTAIGVVLREAVAKGLLTKETLDAISARVSEVALAIASGKVVVVSREGPLTIKEPDEDELAEFDKRANEFPIARTAKKTLDI